MIDENETVQEPPGREASAHERLVSVADELRHGGKWLGAARTWMQSNIRNGDTMIWSSAEPVQIPFCKLEEFARHVAIHAVAEDRAKR